MLCFVANMLSFCMRVFVCMFLPSALCWFLLCFSSFPVSLSLHVKTFHHLHSLFLPLILLSYFLSPTNSHSLETVGDCFNGQYSIHALLQWWGVCGTKWLLLNLCLTICLCMGCVARTNPPSNNGVFSNPVCCMDCKSFQSWCTCLKSNPIPEFDPELNPPQNLSFPETSLSLAPS